MVKSNTSSVLSTAYTTYSPHNSVSWFRNHPTDRQPIPFRHSPMCAALVEPSVSYFLHKYLHMAISVNRSVCSKIDTPRMRRTRYWKKSKPKEEGRSKNTRNWNERNATQKSHMKVIEFQQQQQRISFHCDRIFARTCVCVLLKHVAITPGIPAYCRNEMKKKRNETTKIWPKSSLSIAMSEHTVRTQPMLRGERIRQKFGQKFNSKWIRSHNEINCMYRIRYNV